VTALVEAALLTLSYGLSGRCAANAAVERSLTAKIEDARDALVYKVIEILAVYRSNFAKNIAGTILMVPEQLRHLPLMILSLIKHVRTTVPWARGRTPSVDAQCRLARLRKAHGRRRRFAPAAACRWTSARGPCRCSGSCPSS